MQPVSAGFPAFARMTYTQYLWNLLGDRDGSWISEPWHPKPEPRPPISDPWNLIRNSMKPIVFSWRKRRVDHCIDRNRRVRRFDRLTALSLPKGW